MRRHERFDTSIPIQLFHSDISKEFASSLINISLGGLSFSLADPISIGDEVNIKINHVMPPSELVGTIVWCRRFSDHYEVGLKFSDQGDPFLTRMVEQVCHIENYRISQQQDAGRELSSEQAAEEWIEKFAESYVSNNRSIH